MKLKIKTMVVGPIATNCYLLKEEESGHGLLIDPGAEPERILTAVLAEKTSIDGILLTHGHFDHIGGVKRLKEEFQAPVYLGKRETVIVSNPHYNLSANMAEPFTVGYDFLVSDGQVLRFSDMSGLEIKVIATPGHTIGGVCYYLDGILFSGDTLFSSSYGRVDLPTGDEIQILNSIKNKLLCLPEDTQVFPGHGGSTVIEREKFYYNI